jgi:hypothetical protein
MNPFRNTITYCREWIEMHPKKFVAGLVLIGALFAALPLLAAPTASLSGTVGAGNVPTLTWACGGDATVATATGDWSGTKSLAGSQTLPAFTDTANYGIRCDSPADTSATLTWAAPTQNTDGSALTNLAGFRVYHASSSAGVAGGTPVQLSSPGTLTYQFTGLSVGPHFFAVTAYNSQNVESALSGIGNKTVTAAQSATQVIKFTVPKAPLLSAGGVVFNVKPSFRGFKVAGVSGVIAPGIACNDDFRIKGTDLYRVERRDVKFSRKPTAVVVTACLRA